MPNAFRPAALAASIALAFVAAGVHADAPSYHLVTLDVPDATSVSVEDINDAGVAVGTYTDADFVRHAVVWDVDGTSHELALPGDGTSEVDGIARAINDSGQIVGTADDFVNPTQGLLWNADEPGAFTVLNDDSGAAVSPNDINNDGVVVGGLGVPTRAFVWTEADGLVDYGIQDPGVPDQQARWTAVTDDGKLIGFWNEHVSNIHATIGTVGTPAVLGLGGESDVQRTNAVGMSPSGVAVGLGSLDMSVLVPVVFADDGSFTAIAGATLDQDSGAATAMNEAGVIVGTAGIGTANGAVPGMKAWVHVGGTSYDLFDLVDDTAGFARFATAVAINASGAIVGTGVDAEGNPRSFLLTPAVGDTVFENGFDP